MVNKKFVILILLVLLIAISLGNKVRPPLSGEPAQAGTTERTTTSTQTPITPTSTGTVIPTNSPSPTPTPEPRPYIFVNGEQQIDLSFGPVVIRFTDGALKGKEIVVDLRSPETLCVKKITVGDKEVCEFESTAKALQVGNGIGLIRKENFGNLLLLMHSGYFHNKPLQAEVLRFFFERWGKNGEDYVIQKLAEIEGSTGSIYINDESVIEVKITAAVRLENGEAEELRLHPENVLNIVAKKNESGFIALGNPETFDSVKNNGHEILITFCGWGPNQETTYYRYVVLMEVIEIP